MTAQDTTNPAESHAKPRPWIVAAWPGMGNVAIIAAGYLIQELGMREVGELPPGQHFDVAEVETHEGLVLPAALPRGRFFAWQNPGRGRDLIVFVAEAQPTTDTFGYANALLDTMARYGAECVVTFAALASEIHPSTDPRVTGVATDGGTLDMLRRAETQPVGSGQIGGMNGLILGVAAARSVPGMCLLVEIPYFAMGVPNPKAARAALSVFSVLAEIDISLDELSQHAEVVERALLEALEKMQREQEGLEPEEIVPDVTVEGAEPGESAEEEQAGLSARDRDRIEMLFRETQEDLSNAVRLKNELDRLGVFSEYEGRFLDLFKRAG